MILAEVFITTAVLIAVTRILYVSQHVPFIGSYYATIFAVFFLYVPLALMWRRRQRASFIDNSFKKFAEGVAYFVVSAAIIFPLYLIGAHLWEVWLFGRQGPQAVMYPDLLKTAAFQLLLIALPEEFFFRGYMQGALDTFFKKRWRILGASLGLAWPLTALVFALSHSFIRYQWWHFSIFFPALLFGWLRERTGSITAPVFFHAASNIISDWVVRCYY